MTYFYYIIGFCSSQRDQLIIFIASQFRWVIVWMRLENVFLERIRDVSYKAKSSVPVWYDGSIRSDSKVLKKCKMMMLSLQVKSLSWVGGKLYFCPARFICSFPWERWPMHQVISSIITCRKRETIATSTSRQTLKRISDCYSCLHKRNEIEGERKTS